MDSFVRQSREQLQVLFWGAVAFAAGQALRRRHLFHRVAPYAPLTAGAAAAYLLGWFVGGALLSFLP